MGAPRTTDKILDYLVSRPGQVVYRGQISEATGLDAEQVKHAVSDLRTRIGENITTVTRGASWIWRPRQAETPVSAAPAARQMFEQIGTTKGGDLIIQSDAGTLYRATELS